MVRFVQPQPDQDSPQHDPIVGVFCEFGLEQHAAALARLIRSGADDLGQELDDQTEYELEHLATQLRAYTDASTTIVLLRAVLLLARSTYNGTHSDPEGATVVSRLIGHLAHDHSDLSEPLRTLFANTELAAQAKDTGVARVLLTTGLVAPARFLSSEAIRTTKKHLGSWNEDQIERNPALPVYWVVLDPSRTITACEQLLQQEPITTLGALAWGLQRCLELGYPTAKHLYPLLGPSIQLLCSRWRHESGPADELLTSCCWAYSQLVNEAAPALLGDDYKPLHELALAELGRMRSWLRNGDAAVALDVQRMKYVQDATYFVIRTAPGITDKHGGGSALWQVLRRFLLAFRELKHRSVPLDLRTWGEPALEPLPHPWSWIPSQISNMLGLFLARELERDPNLHDLRRDLAQYCLDRLKTRDRTPGEPGANALVEPDPAWRSGYLHAIRELHPNLGERGLNVLRWSSEHDPDEAVRAEANRVRQAMRRGHGLPADLSPRRTVFAAFWWLRQAHVLGLGEAVDEPGAQRTYRKEMRRQAQAQI